MTQIIDALHLAARVLLLLAVASGSAVLLWGLLSEPIAQLRARLTREPAAAAGGGLSADDDDIPGWAALAGAMLILAFLYLCASAYFGLPSLSR
jgi:hypothetical protein